MLLSLGRASWRVPIASDPHGLRVMYGRVTWWIRCKYPLLFCLHWSIRRCPMNWHSRMLSLCFDSSEDEDSSKASQDRCQSSFATPLLWQELIWSSPRQTEWSLGEYSSNIEAFPFSQHSLGSTRGSGGIGTSTRWNCWYWEPWCIADTSCLPDERLTLRSEATSPGKTRPSHRQGRRWVSTKSTSTAKTLGPSPLPWRLDGDLLTVWGGEVV